MNSENSTNSNAGEEQAVKAPQVANASSSLRTLRLLAGMTLEQVSSAAETAPAYLSKVETGKLTPQNAFVARIAGVIAAHMQDVTRLRVSEIRNLAAQTGVTPSEYWDSHIAPVFGVPNGEETV